MEVTDSAVERFQRVSDEESQSATRLWQQCQPIMMRRASFWVRRIVGRGFDAEDLAISAFAAVWQQRCDGRFDEINSPARLRGLLIRIIDHKAMNRLRAERCVKRGGGRVRGEGSVWRNLGSRVVGLDECQESRAVPPDAEIEIRDTLEQLLTETDPRLRHIVLMRLDGKPLEEIAEQIGCSVATVMRKLRRIEDRWKRIVTQ